MGRTNLFFRSITDGFGITNPKKTAYLERKEDLKDLGITFASDQKPMSAKQQAKEQIKYEQTLQKEREKLARKSENKAQMANMLKSSMGMPSATDQMDLSNVKIEVKSISFEQASAEKIYEGIAQIVNEAKSALLPKGLMDREAMFLKGHRLSLYESISDKVEIGLLKLNSLMQSGEADHNIITLAQKKQAELEAIKETINKHRKNY